MRRVLVLSVAAILAGCSGDGDDRTVGRAGDQQISATEVRQIVADLPESTRRSIRGDRQALERVVRSELMRRALVAEAKSAKLDSEPAVAEELDRVRDEALLRLWLARQASVAPGYPSDEDLKLAFGANQAALTPPPQYRVAQIFVSAPNGIDATRLAAAMRKATDVGGRIPDGDFAALAREYSEHAESARRGGDVGLLPANQMLPEIVAAVSGLEVGATAGPVKTSQGLHYVKLLEKKTSPAPTLESTREQLRAALRAQRAQELERAYLADLNARLAVSVDQIALAQLDADGADAPGQ
jgi:peptidylprolyl isomerase